MDPIKEAFDKIKQDILILKAEITELKYQVSVLEQENQDLKHQNTDSAIPTHIPTQVDPLVSTPTHIPTHPTTLEVPISQNSPFSIGNGGVPTDNPTDRQTIQQTDKNRDFKHFSAYSDFEKASEILNSLDSIKKEIRLKFKRLTNQEMLVFTTLYSLENQNIDEISYKTIAHTLSLSESSIRDYITKLTVKGIPILKIRQNNKKISLRISPDLHKIASLPTIIKLREL